MISISPWIGKDDLGHSDLIDIPLCLQRKIDIEIIPCVLDIYLLSNSILPCIIGGHRKGPTLKFLMETFQISESSFRGLKKIEPFINVSVFPHPIFFACGGDELPYPASPGRRNRFRAKAAFRDGHILQLFVKSHLLPPL